MFYHYQCLDDFTDFYLLLYSLVRAHSIGTGIFNATGVTLKIDPHWKMTRPVIFQLKFVEK